MLPRRPIEAQARRAVRHRPAVDESQRVDGWADHHASQTRCRDVPGHEAVYAVTRWATGRALAAISLAILGGKAGRASRSSDVEDSASAAGNLGHKQQDHQHAQQRNQSAPQRAPRMAGIAAHRCRKTHERGCHLLRGIVVVQHRPCFRVAVSALCCSLVCRLAESPSLTSRQRHSEPPRAAQGARDSARSGCCSAQTSTAAGPLNAHSRQHASASGYPPSEER